MWGNSWERIDNNLCSTVVWKNFVSDLSFLCSSILPAHGGRARVVLWHARVCVRVCATHVCVFINQLVMLTSAKVVSILERGKRIHISSIRFTAKPYWSDHLVHT